MFANMVTSLFEHGRITTTDARAKELRRMAARMITLGKKNTIHAKRLASKTVRTRSILVKLFDEIAPGYSERHGGYTRIMKLGPRRGDNAPMSIIELMPSGAPVAKASTSAPVAPTIAAPAEQPDTKESFEE